MPDSCPLCGGSERPVVSERDRHGKPLKTVICLDCGTVANDPIPTDEELAQFYRTDYRTEYKGVAEPRMRQVWRNFGRTAKHIGAFRDFYRDRKRCLDMGAGSGEFMYLAGRIGMDCLGIEPDERYSAYCRDRLGLTVRSQTLEESDFADGSFDLIRLSHVLEHMRDPVRSLKTLRRWLDDDGLIYIEVPNIDREATDKLRGRIFHFGHIFNFSPWTMRAAALLAGLEEHPDSARLNGAETMGFFRKAVIASGPRDIVNRPKAQFTFNALTDHYSRTIPRPKEGSAVGRGVQKIRLRLDEIIAARRFDRPEQIAEHFSEHLTGSFAR